MRRFPHSWQTLRTKLGFKRSRTRQQSDRRHRSSRIEPLEARELLSSDPLVIDGTDFEQLAPLYATAITVEQEASYVLIDDTPLTEDRLVGLEEGEECPEYFIVTTTQTKAGPQATVSINPEFAGMVPTGLQTRRLELQLNGQVLEEYEISIDIAEEAFRTEFLADRVRATQEQVTSNSDVDLQQLSIRFASTSIEGTAAKLANIVGPLTVDQQSLMDASSASVSAKMAAATDNDLQALASRSIVGNDPLESQFTRAHLYAEMAGRIQEMRLEQANKSSVTGESAVRLREDSYNEMALLLAEDLSEDLDSIDAEVSSAARGLRNELVAVSDTYHTLFTGLKLDHEFERSTNGRGDLKIFAAVESGAYRFTPQVMVELGDYQAMVQVVQRNQQSIASLEFDVEGSSVVEDGKISQASPTTSYGSTSTLDVTGTPAANVETLIKFNLGEYASFHAPLILSDSTRPC
ncbi:hypothetical protein [Aeoliella mucimassa]|uniref:Uncharacterized protein n=1 Tax=Aeoliella mucimassa TaxID=2527972 RepID=A0A518AUZ3_9BACT|nr:hypothetical protein [Aeoliella mucimassa]QDU58545.1 hypothetical protein Pan181_47830 [Aeoliella mucimassa]